MEGTWTVLRGWKTRWTHSRTKECHTEFINRKQPLSRTRRHRIKIPISYGCFVPGNDELWHYDKTILQKNNSRQYIRKTKHKLRCFIKKNESSTHVLAVLTGERTPVLILSVCTSVPTAENRIHVFIIFIMFILCNLFKDEISCAKHYTMQN